MLLTKLHAPAAGPTLVHRPELFTELDKGLHRKLILVSAPAGYGKSTLIADWIRQQDIISVWLSLDKTDNDPVEFLTYIIKGIQGILPGFGQKASELIRSLDKLSVDSILTLLVNDLLQSAENLVLVLDDFHLITDPEVLGILDFLLEHAPATLHLLIATRSDPALPLARLRSQQQLVELRSTDLSFSAADISELFNRKMRIRLSIEDIHALEAKTEGWIAGLQLAGLSLQGSDDASSFIKAFAGNNRYIMDYLIEEVLANQEESTRDFLLKTSVLEQLSASLCNSVLGRRDSQEQLEELDNRNMFLIPLDTERKWYRYHHLFADLLKQRSIVGDAGEIRQIHLRACDWFEKQEMFDMAITHSIEVGDFDRSMILLDRVAEGMWEKGLHTALLKYGTLVPDELILRHPGFGLYYAWILIAGGKVDQAQRYLESAERILKQEIQEQKKGDPYPEGRKKLLGKIAVAFAYLHSSHTTPDKTFAHSKTALENLSEDDTLWFSWAWFSKGMAHFACGQLMESREALYTALEQAKKTENIYLNSSIVTRLAELEQELGSYTIAQNLCTELMNSMKDKGYLQFSKTEWTFAPLYLTMGVNSFTWAEMETSREYMQTAYELSQKGNDIFLKIFVMMFYSFLLWLWGDPSSKPIRDELERLLTSHSIPPHLMSMVNGWRVYFYLTEGKMDDANGVISRLDLGLDKEKTHSNEIEYMAWVRILLAEGNLKDAETILQDLLDLAKSGLRVERLIELSILFAALYRLEGDREKSAKWLIDSMKLAASENILTYFVSTRELLGDMLLEVHKMAATRDIGVPADFLSGLKEAMRKMDEFMKVRYRGDLSEREMDTLKLMAEGLMNQEIADKLFISRNTVKTHVKNILLKLEMDNRTEAVKRARQLGIL